jgi:DNA phosphorothioation-associated putative methyltransferase
LQNDIKGLFGNYKQACAAADLMLVSVGDLRLIANCCKRSALGKLLPNALYVHVSALEALNPQLRLYEGCASRTIGRMDGATLVKFHFNVPKISYLFYPDFDTEPHPALHTSMQIDLRDLQVVYRDYDTSENPPILHRKETFVMPDYPDYEKFAKLTRQEEKWGLLDNTSTIGTRKGWQRCLKEHCAEIKGYRVYWRKDADPYRVKLLMSARNRNKS